MRFLNWQACLERLGLVSSVSKKRVSKLRSRWGIEGEQLENRALMSAANELAVGDAPVAAEVQTVARKAQPQYPTVSGTWNVVATSEYFGDGTVTMVQDGKRVTSTVTIQDLPSFDLKATFKRRSPNVLSSKSPRIEVPGVPIDIRVTITITFPQGNLTPATFTGSAKVPFVGTVGTLVGTKVVQTSAITGDQTPRKAAPVANVAGGWTVTVGNVPILGELTGNLQLTQKGRRVTGAADLGNGISFTAKSRFERKDPTVISGKVSVSSPALNVRNAPYQIKLNPNATGFTGTVTANTELGPVTLSLTGIRQVPV